MLAKKKLRKTWTFGSNESYLGSSCFSFLKQGLRAEVRVVTSGYVGPRFESRHRLVTGEDIKRSAATKLFSAFGKRTYTWLTRGLIESIVSLTYSSPFDLNGSTRKGTHNVLLLERVLGTLLTICIIPSRPSHFCGWI